VEGILMSVETCYVTIKSTPEINARVFINGLDTGKKTPYVFDLTKGVYTFKVVDESGNFMFVEWWKDDSFLSKNPEVSVNVETDIVLEARFTPVPPTTTTVEIPIVPILNLLFIIMFMSVIMESVASVRVRR
jgi:hypothetical protein